MSNSLDSALSFVIRPQDDGGLAASVWAQESGRTVQVFGVVRADDTIFFDYTPPSGPAVVGTFYSDDAMNRGILADFLSQRFPDDALMRGQWNQVLDACALVLRWDTLDALANDREPRP